MKPIVGITTYVTNASFGAWNVESALVPSAYVSAVKRAGGCPLLVPPGEEDIEETIDAVHGLIFSGGPDLDPDTYGQQAHPQTNGVNPERDKGELALLGAALERDLPVLAVCRGSQVMNVALGGDLLQHLPELVGHEKHKEIAGTFSDHDVSLVPGTRLAGLLGERAPVKSHHHQGFGRLGDGLQEAAWAEDGTLEAIEDPERTFALGVLWHPEEGQDQRLFEALVAAAREYRRG